MTFTCVTHAEEATWALARALGPLLQAGDAILLSGDLGAGKTAFVKGLAEGLEVPGTVTSPTFNILLVHPGRLPLYHMDLYRLETPDQLQDIDYFGTVEADGVTAVEWGDRFPEAAPLDYLGVTLSISGDTTRSFEAVAHGPRGEQLAGAWLVACEALAGVECRR
ncbi:MAG: tRNA (adenosine(37)-N6)-threonylcarbamoyltransferase complex ATPase subunit type 1 TsaE [Coriobacteriia bacterium]